MNKINKIEIIAEIGWNHMGDNSLAEQMIKSAKENGANTVKFQYWDPCILKVEHGIQMEEERYMIRQH